MRAMCSREIFTKKCRQQQIFDSDLKGAWYYNHVTFTPIAKNFMLYCRLIYMLSILYVEANPQQENNSVFLSPFQSIFVICTPSMLSERVSVSSCSEKETMCFVTR